MAKLTKQQLSDNGKKLMTLAKKIRSENPSLKWTDCVSKAGKAISKNRPVKPYTRYVKKAVSSTNNLSKPVTNIPKSFDGIKPLATAKPATTHVEVKKGNRKFLAVMTIIKEIK